MNINKLKFRFFRKKAIKIIGILGCITLISVLVCSVFGIDTPMEKPFEETEISNTVEATIAVTEPTETVFETEVSIESVECTEAIETCPLDTPNNSNAINAKTSNSGTPNTWDEYVGRFKISSVGVNVGCYASNSQSTVDASDSAAYYYGNSHYIIADHTNQGFNAIKSCSVGTKASITSEYGVKNYTCVGKIQGHNTGHGLTDANWNDINDMYEGCLVCYTCNENWQNVTIVFFEPDDGESAGVGDFYDEDEYGYYDDKDSGSEVTMTSNGKQYIYDPDSEEWFLDEETENCNHSWGAWEFFCTGMEERICEKCWMGDYRLTQKTTRIETENDSEDDVSEPDDWTEDWSDEWVDSDTFYSIEYEDETISEAESETIAEYEDEYSESIEFENEESSEN